MDQAGPSSRPSELQVKLLIIAGFGLRALLGAALGVAGLDGCKFCIGVASSLAKKWCADRSCLAQVCV